MYFVEAKKKKHDCFASNPILFKVFVLKIYAPEVNLVMQCPINVILYHRIKWRTFYIRKKKVNLSWSDIVFFLHSLIRLNVVEKSIFLINHKYFNPILRNESSEMNVKPNIKRENKKGYGTGIPVLIRKVFAG